MAGRSRAHHARIQGCANAGCRWGRQGHDDGKPSPGTATIRAELLAGSYTPLPARRVCIPKAGKDVTVVSYGVSMWDSVFAAKKLEEEFGYSVEVIDMRTIIPLDEGTIFRSVRKTNKVIVIHEDTLTGGFGAEIAARIADNCFQYLDGPGRRIAAKDTHIPYAPLWENEVLPSRQQIYSGIKELIEF